MLGSISQADNSSRMSSIQQKLFDRNSPPPVSFVYDGKPSSVFIHSWTRTIKPAKTADGITKTVYEYTDPKTQLVLQIECLVYTDFPAIEWVPTLINRGKVDTPVIEKFQAIDTNFEITSSTRVIIHRMRGSAAANSDFMPHEIELHVSTSPLFFAPLGGRSSNKFAAPFFNIDQVGTGGVMISIGWTGQWWTDIYRTTDTAVNLRTGMQFMQLKLHPGESIRQPRILLVFWKGTDWVDAQNLFRRFMLKHKTPKGPDGKPVTLPLACSSSALHNLANKANVENQIDYAKTMREYGFDYLWIDAGWAEGGSNNGCQVGTWTPAKERFPNGFKPITDELKKLGMKFVLWFEPERSSGGKWIDQTHPDWVIFTSTGTILNLVNFGNPDVRKYFIDFISNLIKRDSINIYRQDFNMDPLTAWKQLDSPNRIGIAEIRHVEGLYAFWDDLVKHNPGLIIDNCASGGRRLDLETVARSIALWRSDYRAYESVGYQSQTYGLSFWIPTTSIGSLIPNKYAFRSAMTNGIVCVWNPYDPNFDKTSAKNIITEFKRIRHMFYGDYYPLTPYTVRKDAWLAYQFNCPDTCDGMALAFRRDDCKNDKLRIFFHGINPNNIYDVKYEDTGIVKQMTGNEMMSGFEITTSTAPESVLLTYKVSTK